MNVTLKQIIDALAGKSDSRTHVHINEFSQMPLYMVSRKQLLDELFKDGRWFTEQEVAEVGKDVLTKLAEEYLRGRK